MASDAGDAQAAPRTIATATGAAAEAAAMSRAVALAERGRGATRPNPVVGAVILAADGTTVVGEGWHARAGGPHAEVNALAEAGERARGGTCVVTLEPCNAPGRTGPCSQALLAAGVRRVVVAVRDPCPAFAGGAERLREAGVEVAVGLLAEAAARGNEAWLTATRRHRPHVTWKYAASLDGRVAAADGSSKWVTSEQARADGHRLRAGVDAIVVGVGTVLADDPHLTARGAPRPEHAPLVRVVVDTNAKTPPAARVLDAAAPTIVAVAEDADAAHLPPRAVARLPRADRGLDLRALLALLFDRDVRAVLVEGGPTLAGSFVSAGLVDRVVAYVAPALLGGGGLPALAGAGAATIAAAHRLRLDEVARVGPDLRLSARVPEEE